MTENAAAIIEIITVIGVIAVAIAGLVVALLCARWTMGALDRAAAKSTARLQVTIADVLCFFLQIQLLLASLKAVSEMKRISSDAIPIVVLIFVAAAAIWGISVAALSRARVRNAWHRVFVLIIGVPVGVLSSLAVTVIPLFLFAGITTGNWELLWLVPIGLVTLGSLVGIRRMIRHIVAAAQRPDGE